MNVGTKSLLFGVHQIILHPIFVTWAWRKLYKSWPNWKELVCIIVHDWGYWGKPDMDGEEGKDHPYLGGYIADWLFGDLWMEFCALHSRWMANRWEMPVSKLCAPDKYALTLYPKWLYYLLATASGELSEYLHEGRRFWLYKDGDPFDEWYNGIVEYGLAQIESYLEKGNNVQT